MPGPDAPPQALTDAQIDARLAALGIVPRPEEGAALRALARALAERAARVRAFAAEAREPS